MLAYRQRRLARYGSQWVHDLRPEHIRTEGVCRKTGSIDQVHLRFAGKSVADVEWLFYGMTPTDVRGNFWDTTLDRMSHKIRERANGDRVLVWVSRR